MTAGELAVVLAAVLCSIGFAALIVVLLRVLDTMRSLRAEVDIAARRDSAAAGRVAGIDRRCQSHDGRGSRRSRSIRSGARLGRGDQWCDGRWQPRRPRGAQHAGHQDRCAGHRHVAGGSPPAPQGTEIGMMKRVTWFVGGAVAGVAGAGIAKRKVKQAADASSAQQRRARHRMAGVRDAVGEGRRAMRAREVELRARLDGRATTLADDLDEGDEVLVDGGPVEPGQVIVLKQVRDRHDDRRRRGMIATLARRAACGTVARPGPHR